MAAVDLLVVSAGGLATSHQRQLRVHRQALDVVGVTAVVALHVGLGAVQHGDAGREVEDLARTRQRPQVGPRKGDALFF